MGYLVKPRHFGWGGLADWSKLKVQDGEFDQQQATQITMDLRFNQTVVKKFVEMSGRRIAICFAHSVQQSRLLCHLFNSAGITCEHLEANTLHDVRREMYKRLKTGETQVLSSVGSLKTRPKHILKMKTVVIRN